MHPLEKKSNNAAKLRHAMGNVFASRTYLQKLKVGGQPCKPPTFTAAATNNNKH